MMALQLKETTMDINTRSLIRVTVPTSDFKKTNKLISNIMGKNADLRLKFIEENAPKVKNIDL
jgi:topoisomerase-4 subunit B